MKKNVFGVLKSFLKTIFIYIEEKDEPLLKQSSIEVLYYSLTGTKVFSEKSSALIDSPKG